MKCATCGSELADDTCFCPHCGTRVEAVAEATPTEASPSADTAPTSDQFGGMPPIAGKGNGALSGLNRFDKAALVAVVLAILFLLAAFVSAHPLAGFVAIAELAAALVAVLMRRHVIKPSKSWFPHLALVMSFVLIAPYSLLLGGNGNAGKFERYNWSDVVLSDVLPQPASAYGTIVDNSNDRLLLHVNDTSSSQYRDYISQCKAKGFTVDAEQIGSGFDAYNASGYKLSLAYDEDGKEVYLSLDAAVKLGTLSWPDSDLSKLLPVPKSTIGEVQEESATELIVCVGETSIEDYRAYVTACSDKGFTVDSSKTSKTFNAKDENSYKLSVDYQGNNVVRIAVYVPEYDTTLEVDCDENWFFSKYDVRVYLDDLSRGVLKHGDSNTYDVSLLKGPHTLKVVNDEDSSVTGTMDFDVTDDSPLKVKLYCSSSRIRIESESSQAQESNQDEEATTEPAKISVSKGSNDFEGANYKDAETELRQMGFTTFEYKVVDTDDQSKTDGMISYIEINEGLFGKSEFAQGDQFNQNATVVLHYYECEEVLPNLTVENCPELASILSNKAESDPSYSAFARKYVGRNIEFDGRVDYCAPHGDYKTRFDYLVSTGDYDPNHQIGPAFKFEEVNHGDLHANVDTVSVGMNVHIIAKVVRFDSNSMLFYLDPVAVTSR